MNNEKHKIQMPQKQSEKLSADDYNTNNVACTTGPLIFVQPIQKAHAQQPPCSLSQVQPSDPVDMNTVIFKTMAKTIHVEKEVYTNCRGIIPTVLDVSTYTELREEIF